VINRRAGSPLELAVYDGQHLFEHAGISSLAAHVRTPVPIVALTTFSKEFEAFVLI
jgi:hypothetical protein